MNKEFYKMQKIAGLITENQFRQLTEAESALQTYLTGIANELNKKPEVLAKEITDYLNSIMVVKDGEVPGTKSTGKETVFVAPSKKGAPFLMVTAKKSGGKFIANEEISNWLAKTDPRLKNEAQNEVMKAYLQDRKITEPFGGFEKLPSASHPNDFGVKQESNNQLNEEEKNINTFGKNLMDRLTKSAFDAKFVDNELKRIELEKIVKENPKKLAVVYFDKAFNYVLITTNKDNQDEALKVAESVKSFLPDGYTISKQGSYFVEIQPKL
jgi:hypothetical protein